MSDERPGYDEAVEAIADLARAPRCSAWGEGLTIPRVRALLDTAYPIIEAAVEAMHVCPANAGERKEYMALGRTEQARRIVAALRSDHDAGWHEDGRPRTDPGEYADYIEERFGDG